MERGVYRGRRSLSAHTPGESPTPEASPLRAGADGIVEGHATEILQAVAGPVADAYEEFERATTRWETQETLEKEMHESWFLLTTFVLLCNVALWSSIGYQVQNIELYKPDTRNYEIWAWVAPFGVALLIFVITIPVWKFAYKLRRPESGPESTENTEPRQTPKKPIFPKRKLHQQIDGETVSVSGWKYFIAVLNAIFCFIGVVAYFRGHAIHKYFRSEWEYEIDYNGTFYPPGFAFASGGDFGDTALASFAGTYTNCTFPKWVDKSKVGEPGNDCPPGVFNNTITSLNISSDAYSKLDARIFYPNNLPNNQSQYEDLSSRVVLQNEMNFNSSNIEAQYKNELQLSPYVFGAIYDKRLDLAKAVHCGLIAFTEMPAMGSTTFTMSATNITDTLGMISPPTNEIVCQNYYREVLSYENPPYTAYTFHMASMPVTDLSVCDISVNPGNKCLSQVILRYGTRAVSSMESKPGIEKQQILIDEGAIVGAIQFFMWFLSLYVL